MTKLKRRMVFDLLLTVVLVFEMLHQFTGDELHEYVGFAFFACIVVHLCFARNWLASTARQFGERTASRRRKALALIAALLLLDTVALLVSSLAISRTLWDLGLDLTVLNPGKILYPVHTASAYLLCILVLVHLASHWMAVASVLRVEYDPSRRAAIEQGVRGLVAAGGVALGIVGAMRVGQSAGGRPIAKDDYLNSRHELEATGGTSTQHIGGYREKNAQTGEFTSGRDFEVEDLAGQGGADRERADGDPAISNAPASEDGICPLCPRQCMLSAPNCERPYEAGLI